METYISKYQNGKIYKITDIDYNKCYYGSTIQSLSMRMGGHRRKYNEFKNGEYHKFSVFDIFDEYGMDNCKIELVENFPCLSKDELEAREGFYIKNNECVNRIIVGRTRRQYYDDNKDKKSDYNKEYYNNNKEHIIKTNTEYYEQNKDKIFVNKKEYYENHKDIITEYQKMYRQDADNKIRISQNKKVYYDEHKDELSERKKKYYESNKGKFLEKTECSTCGGVFVKSCKARHERSQKHINALLITDN
jgi:hypothetical protein